METPKEFRLNSMTGGRTEKRRAKDERGNQKEKRKIFVVKIVQKSTKTALLISPTGKLPIKNDQNWASYRRLRQYTVWSTILDISTIVYYSDEFSFFSLSPCHDINNNYLPVEYI